MIYAEIEKNPCEKYEECKSPVYFHGSPIRVLKHEETSFTTEDFLYALDGYLAVSQDDSDGNFNVKTQTIDFLKKCGFKEISTDFFYIEEMIAPKDLGHWEAGIGEKAKAKLWVLGNRMELPKKN